MGHEDEKQFLFTSQFYCKMQNMVMWIFFPRVFLWCLFPGFFFPMVNIPGRSYFLGDFSLFFTFWNFQKLGGFIPGVFFGLFSFGLFSVNRGGESILENTS